MRKKKALAYLLCTLFLYKVVESTSSRVKLLGHNQLYMR